MQIVQFQEGSAYNEAAKAYDQPIHDPIHRYITTQNSPNDGTFNAGEGYADSLNNLPTYAEPYYGYPGVVPAPAPAQGPYSGYNTGVYNPGAFTIQSGYDGYLVPGPAQQQAKSVVARNDPVEQTSALSNFFPSMRSIANILGLLTATIFGGGITTLICFFTPLCSITFLPFGVRRAEADIEQLDEAVNEAQVKLTKSVEKITKMENEEKANTPTKITAKGLEPEDKSNSDNLEKVEKSSAATPK